MHLTDIFHMHYKSACFSLSFFIYDNHYLSRSQGYQDPRSYNMPYNRDSIPSSHSSGRSYPNEPSRNPMPSHNQDSYSNRRDPYRNPVSSGYQSSQGTRGESWRQPPSSDTTRSSDGGKWGPMLPSRNAPTGRSDRYDPYGSQRVST